MSEAGYSQVYYNLTDSLLKPNRVRIRTMMTADDHLGERWSYDKNGNQANHTNYYPGDSLPIMSTDLVYDSNNRLTVSLPPIPYCKVA